VTRTANGFVARFGRKSATAKAVVAEFCASLALDFKKRPSGVATLLFESWRKSFGIESIADRRQEIRRERIARWAKSWLDGCGDEDVFLFAVQCYFASLLKLLAARLAFQATGQEVRFDWMHLEFGEFFRRRGLDNVVNGDVYQAAFHASDIRSTSAFERLCEATPVGEISAYVNGESLKVLYLDLFPREVRHSLGEFHTPGSLVEHVLKAVAFDGADHRSVIDPMCGGGAFLTAICESRLKWVGSAAELLRGLAGVDVHPLAVLTARTAILAVVAKLPKRQIEPLAIPIHAGDAILAAWNRRNADNGKLRVATPLGERLHKTSDSLQGELDGADILGDAAAMTRDAESLAALPQFDLVVGNPPWIGWESLPDDYRKATVPIWQAYGLFPHRGMETILGGGKKDLSMLATLAAADAWLKPGGTLSFVVNETAFKSIGAARGFRMFQVGDASLKVLRVDDMTKLNPFANAATRTTVLTLTKGEPTTYPVRCVQWTSTGRREAVSEPIDPADPQSPWLTASPKALPLLRRMMGASPIPALEGVNTGGANGVYWLRILECESNGDLIVENDPTLGRMSTPTIRAVIEPTFVHSLLRHQDVGRWRAKPSLSILILQDVATRRGVAIEDLERQAPRTLAFIQRFEKQLRKRAAFQRYFNRGDAAFYSMFNVGPRTLASIKVVWRRMISPVEATVVVDHLPNPVLPQETLCFIPCTSESEAWFYAGLMNSDVFNAAALAVSQGSSKSFGAPHLLKFVALPHYDPHSPIHRRIAELREDSLVLQTTAAKAFGFNDEERAVLADEVKFQTQ
jgi:hypothetical protein